jgi:two-component system chemotaxis response regulator CheY
VRWPTLGKRVLVVDDSATVRNYYASILGEIGFSVDQAANGYEALEKAVRDDYDLFLVDVNMPKMPGYDFIRQLREDKRTRALPVVIISTEAGEKDRLEGWRAGANVYLVKPVRPERLKALVKMLIGVR